MGGFSPFLPQVYRENVCPILHLCWLATQVIDLDQEEGRERASGREEGREEWMEVRSQAARPSLTSAWCVCVCDAVRIR